MNRKDGIICHIILVSVVALFIVPAIPMIQRTFAASISDNVGSSSSQTSSNSLGNNGSNSNEKLSTTGSTEASTNDTVAKTLVLTAIPSKETIGVGDTQTIHIKASMSNGTGLSDVNIRALIMDYVTAKQKVLLGGKTDDKGTLDVSAAIGNHAKPGQFVVIINGTKGDQPQKTISTGFVVSDKGGSSSGRCSGSSCK